MIIGIDASRTLKPQLTGTERYALEIIRHLLALPAARAHQWRLYLPAQAPPDLFSSPYDHVQFRVLPARRLWTHRALAWEVMRRPPDVLFIPAHVIPFLPPFLLPPSVVTLHDLGYRHFPQAHPPAQRIYLDLSTRWSATVARRAIAVSHFTADDLHRFYGTPRAKIQVIHEAASEGAKISRQEHTGAETQRGAEERRVLPLRPYVLYLGTIQPRKNLARLIEAYSLLVEGEAVEWDLVLAGKRGWLSDQLYAIARQRGIDERVHFPGYVPEAEASTLMKNALFFAFPSLFEGFGLPVLEAQQKGIAVMCANNSALPEVAGKAAILVDPNDVEAMANAMLQLSQDEALRQKLIAAGYENVKRFSWEKAARETLAVLEEVEKNKE